MRSNLPNLSKQSRPRERERDISVGLAALLACGLLAGCGSSNGSGDGNPEDAPLRYQPTGPVASVPECAQTSLSLSSPQVVAVDGSRCEAQTCRWTYQVNDGDTLTYDGGNTWVFLRFSAPIAGATSTAQLAAAFQHVNFYRMFPVDGGSQPLSAVYFEARTSVDGFDVFELCAAYLPRCIESERAAEYRQSPEGELFSQVEEVVAPLNRCAQGALAFGSIASPTR